MCCGPMSLRISRSDTRDASDSRPTISSTGRPAPVRDANAASPLPIGDTGIDPQSQTVLADPLVGVPGRFRTADGIQVGQVDLLATAMFERTQRPPFLAAHRPPGRSAAAGRTSRFPATPATA